MEPGEQARQREVLHQLGGLLAGARALKAAQRYDDASRELAAGYALLGVERRTLQLADPGEAQRELVDPTLVRPLAELLAHEADLLRLEGDTDSAAASSRWALSVLLRGAPPGDYSSLMRALLAMAERRPPPEPL